MGWIRPSSLCFLLVGVFGDEGRYDNEVCDSDVDGVMVEVNEDEGDGVMIEVNEDEDDGVVMVEVVGTLDVCGQEGGV